MYKQSDQNGNVTRYNYDQYAGRLYSVTDAKGNMTKYTYNNDTNQLTSVSSGGMTNYYHYENDKRIYINSNNSVGYKFTYDNFGRTLKKEVGNGTDHKTLSTMTYDNTKNLLLSQAYGNGDFISYSYDNLDRLTEIKYNNDDSKKKTYIYGTDGNVSSVLDSSSYTRTKYVYDLSGRLAETKEYTGSYITSNQLASSTEYLYQDKTNYLQQMNHSSALGDLAVYFGYGNIANGQMPDQVYSVWWNYNTNMDRTYDGLGRLSSTVINFNEGLRTNYHYKDVSATQTTTQLDYMETPAGALAYTYDSVGNITSIYNGVTLITYEYDSLNQLVRENDQRTGKTYTYTYLNGNITSKTEYAYTTGALGAVQNVSVYGYGDSVWRDLLTSYKGNTITYDEIGNMTRFGGRTFDWTGRQLNNFVDSNSYGIYYYNMDGQRIYKEANGVTTNYYYNGSTLAGQISSDGTKLIFLYDENGDIFGLNYAGDNYYYIKNAQNDVIAIANTLGNILCYYEYDAWGKVISIIGDVAWFGQLNPIRYRSYYYDNESGYYYLQSRYYNPEIGRFICADDIIYLGVCGIVSYNLYSYCINNPVIFYDSHGAFPCFVFEVTYSTEAVLKPAYQTPYAPSMPLPNEFVLPKCPILPPSVLSPTVPIAPTGYQGKPISKRYNFNHRKGAYESAKRAGNGKEPIHHPKGPNNPKGHYHPNVKNTFSRTPKEANLHDHYFYTFPTATKPKITSNDILFNKVDIYGLQF